MSWKVIYDNLVYSEDLKSIDSLHRKRIIRVANKNYLLHLTNMDIQLEASIMVSGSCR